jgi:tetratricopeptide (TPR) repeat protein
MRHALLRFLSKPLPLGLCLFSAAIAAATASPGAGAPNLNAALSQLQNGDAAGAAKSLRQITSFDPQNAAAWRALGTADMMQDHFTAAIADYSRALKLQADSPRVFYQLGAAYAAKHDSRHAFEFLERAQASHRYDMTEISEDLHLAGLRNDSRFNSLLPKASDFERPFVEPVKIIREWHGEAPGDQFGWIARNIGDVDGDGITDIVTSAPTHGDHAGRIYVYSVGSGRLLW